MKETIDPLFTDVTWGAGGSTANLSMDIALQAHNTGHVANLHMTCTNMEGVTDPKQAVLDALNKAKEGGIRNIVALRGDPPAGQDEWKAAEGGLTCALDLVIFIREHFNDEFGIAVAGYPEGHPNAISEIEDPATMTPSEAGRSSHFDGHIYTCKDEDYKKEMDYLKKKVDAGAGMSSVLQWAFQSLIRCELTASVRQILSLHKCSLTLPSLFNLSKIVANGASTFPFFRVSCVSMPILDSRK